VDQIWRDLERSAFNETSTGQNGTMAHPRFEEGHIYGRRAGAFGVTTIDFGDLTGTPEDESKQPSRRELIEA
jgi:hypothetical protein